jgi:hypothetical protein
MHAPLGGAMNGGVVLRLFGVNDDGKNGLPNAAGRSCSIILMVAQ